MVSEWKTRPATFLEMTLPRSPDLFVRRASGPAYFLGEDFGDSLVYFYRLLCSNQRAILFIYFSDLPLDQH
jgi:hypothetical protein